MNTLRLAIQHATCLVASIVLISTLTACVDTTQAAPATVVEGYTTTVNESGIAIGLSPTADGGAGEGYVIAGAMWRDQGGPWKSWQGESCAEPLTSGQQVRLGVVKVEPGEYAPGGPVVAWFECLD